MVFVRLSVRPGVDLGFKTSTNGQDLDGRTGPSLEIKVQVLKSKSGGLPKVNTRVFFSPPFSGELPRVNTTVFCFFFSRPFPAGSLCRRAGLAQS